jgi:hypothetical protein
VCKRFKNYLLDPKTNELGMVAHTIIPAMQEAQMGGWWSEAGSGQKSVIPYLKNKLK